METAERKISTSNFVENNHATRSQCAGLNQHKLVETHGYQDHLGRCSGASANSKPGPPPPIMLRQLGATGEVPRTAFLWKCFAKAHRWRRTPGQMSKLRFQTEHRELCPPESAARNTGHLELLVPSEMSNQLPHPVSLLDSESTVFLTGHKNNCALMRCDGLDASMTQLTLKHDLS